MRCVVDSLMEQAQGFLRLHGSLGGQTRAQRQPDQAGPQIYWGLHTHTLTASHNNGTVTQDIKVASAIKVGPRGSGLQPPPIRPRPCWVLPLGQLRKGRGCWGGPRAWQGVSRQVGPAGWAGQKPPHSRDCSISSCFSTFVWLVSRISPARNISSTTV